MRIRASIAAKSRLVVECSVLISSESPGIDSRSVARHGDELLPGDESAAFPKRDQFPDAVAVAGDGKRLPMLDGIHDLPRPGPQVALA
jgi:hypothetical protein